MKIKKLLGVICCITAAFGMCMSASAAPKTMPDGQIFDPQFYAKTYPAVNELAKGDETLLYAHYANIGKLLNYQPYDMNAAKNNGTYAYKNPIFNEAMKNENSKATQCFMKVSALDSASFVNGEFKSDRQWLMHITSPRMTAGKHYATATDNHGWNSPIPATQVDFYETFGMDMKDAKNNWDASMKMMAAQGFDTDLDKWVEVSANSINDQTIRHEFKYNGQCAAVQNMIATIDYDSIEGSSVEMTIDQHVEAGVTKFYNFSFLYVCVDYKKDGLNYKKYISYTP